MSEQTTIKTHEQHGLPGARQINCKINGKNGRVYLTPDHIQIFTEKTVYNWLLIIIAIILAAGTIYGYLNLPSLDWLWVLIDVIALLILILGFDKKVKQETIVFYEDAVVKRKHTPPFHKHQSKQEFDEKRTVNINYSNNKAKLVISYGNKTFTINLSNIREPQAKLFEQY